MVKVVDKQVRVELTSNEMSRGRWIRISVIGAVAGVALGLFTMSSIGAWSALLGGGTAVIVAGGGYLYYKTIVPGVPEIPDGEENWEIASSIRDLLEQIHELGMEDQIPSALKREQQTDPLLMYLQTFIIEIQGSPYDKAIRQGLVAQIGENRSSLPGRNSPDCERFHQNVSAVSFPAQVRMACW